MSKQSFADLGVSSAVVDVLSRQRIIDPFPVQRLVIGDVLAGRDVLTKSPTGSGKTLAFGIAVRVLSGGDAWQQIAEPARTGTGELRVGRGRYAGRD